MGNKYDLKDQRVVEYKTAAKLSLENSIGFIETSAATGENVVEAFTILSKNILNKIESGKVNLMMKIKINIFIYSNILIQFCKFIKDFVFF